MGDWIYYTTVMGFAEVVEYVKFAEEVCPNTDLDLMIQREVGNRSKQISQYLRTNSQRFFGSLIVAVYDGKPRFGELTEDGLNCVGLGQSLNHLKSREAIAFDMVAHTKAFKFCHHCLDLFGIQKSANSLALAIFEKINKAVDTGKRRIVLIASGGRSIGYFRLGIG